MRLRSRSAVSNLAASCLQALLLVACFVVSIAAEKAGGADNSWEENKPAGAKEKARTFFQKYGVVLAYLALMACMKAYQLLLPAEKAEPGGNVKSVHTQENWQSLLQTAKESKQLARAIPPRTPPLR